MKETEKCYSQLCNWFPDIPQSEIGLFLMEYFEAGQALTTKGQLFQQIFIVLDGICNVINQLDNGAEIITLKLSPGDVIGVSESILSHARYIASVKACTPVTVAKLEENAFQRWLYTSPSFLNFILKNLVIRLHYTAELSANCQTSISKVNLAKFFIDRCHIGQVSAPPSRQGTVRIQETHEMMGNFLGITPRTVERHIRALKAEGMVDIEKGKVLISPAQYQQLLDFVASNL